MALLAQKLPSRLALVSVCCIVLVFVVFRQVPRQKVQIKHINIEQSVQILEPHQEYSNKNSGKTTSREAKTKREDNRKASPVSGRHISAAGRKFQGRSQHKLKWTEQYQAVLWDNPDDFWNMTYEERSKVSTPQLCMYLLSRDSSLHA